METAHAEQHVRDELMASVRTWLRGACLGAAAVALMLGVVPAVTPSAHAQGGPPIKIGILHSLSGTMAISEDRKSVV